MNSRGERSPRLRKAGRLVRTVKPTTDARVAHRFELDLKQGALGGRKRKLRTVTNRPACAFKGIESIF